MTETQDLIAAALRLAALAERNTDCRDEWQEAIDSVREACARAMVQPDIAEVERLVSALTAGAHDSMTLGDYTDEEAARAALLDYVRDHFRDATKMVQPVGDVPEIRFGNMLDCRTCAHFTADGCNSTVMCMEADQYKATVPRRYWATMSGEVKL